MMLRDLSPELVGTIADGVLYFDCPFPACRQSPHGPHSVRVPISSAPSHERSPRPGEPAQSNGKVKVWQASGAFPDTLTITPSIDLILADKNGNKIRTLCWHGFITNGAVT
jgi:hypothetical protein